MIKKVEDQMFYFFKKEHKSISTTKKYDVNKLKYLKSFNVALTRKFVISNKILNISHKIINLNTTITMIYIIQNNSTKFGQVKKK